MKTTIFIALYLCSMPFFGQDNYIENVSLNCIYEAFNAKNIDIKKELEAYETFLIKNSFLNDNSGKSYINFFKKMKEINNIPATRPDSLFLKIVNVFRNSYSKECVTQKIIKEGRFKSLYDFRNTKVYKMEEERKKIKEYTHTLFKDYANLYLTMLDESDYQKQYFKTTILLSIALGSNMEGHEQFTKLLPPEYYTLKKNEH
ncbi:hypothetical protein [Aquimarina macrocephali]|uniref:hypothetical protein n=1 Tax=Aquimarina macrocephali TaxID=666563 RepID=UPI0004AE657F|nr:hypothetical protein [Aquimarina macrocephali]